MMCSKETSRVQRQKVTKAKLKTKMVVSKAFLALPVRKSPEISVTCLSRKTHLKFSSSLKLKEKSLGATLGLTQHKVQQSRETSVYTQGRLASKLNKQTAYCLVLFTCT